MNNNQRHWNDALERDPKDRSARYQLTPKTVDAPMDLPQSLRNLKIAIVHYWFLNGLGGERVTRILAQMFPQADVFTLLANYDAIPSDLRAHRIKTSFIQRIPGARRWHRHLLPLYPIAIEQFDLSEYDLVISAESGPAKGVITSPRTCHICFCHSPMRYLWDMYHEYHDEPSLGVVGRALFSLSAHYVRMWDIAAAARVDYFAAISNHVANRIRKFYRREATVIHPPLKVDGAVSQSTGDYYLIVSRLVSYKRIELAIEACNRLGRELHVIGDGEQANNLRQLAGPTIKFLGFLPDAQVREEFARCRAFLFPGEEDLGATPVEAQSFGRPVIAYGRGGVLDTVNGLREGENINSFHSGIFFDRQDVRSMVNAILLFEKVESQFCRNIIRERVLWFGEPRFRQEMYNYVEQCYADFASAERSRDLAGLFQSAPGVV